MPTRQLPDDGWFNHSPFKRRCAHPEHEPPKMQVFSPGVYEHECPACGEKTVFVVREKGTL